MRIVGLHLRIIKDLFDVAERAQRMGLRSFQCFLVHQITQKHIVLSDQEIVKVHQMRDNFEKLYVHGAYWINICGKNFRQAAWLLKKELKLAKRLGFSHYILHPGSAAGWPDHENGIDCFVKALNGILKDEHDIKIVLENTAHGGRSVGSDLYDFKVIQDRVAFPEKVSFCIDTAHAHSFGYDVITPAGLESFIALLDETVGIDNIELLHLNDTNEEVGLKHDKHEMIGDGLIGHDSLQRLALHHRLKEIPIILELPDVSDAQQNEMVNIIKNWEK